MLIPTDVSIFEIEHKEALYSNSRDDLINSIRILFSEKQSFTMSSDGISIGGQSIAECVLEDILKHLTNIIDFHKEEKEILVEPGVIQDNLNSYFKPYNLKFALILEQ